MSDEISTFLQQELRYRDRTEVTAVDAATWLDQAGLLADSASRPGSPLRKLLRRGEISGGEQRPPVANGRWFIVKSGSSEVLSAPAGPASGGSIESTRPPDSESSEALDAEVKRSVAALDHPAEIIELDELPDGPGLYTIEARSKQALAALGLDDQSGQASLVTRILYLGKAENSVNARLRMTHFAIGKTGQSTVRRTFAALLDLPVILRPSRQTNPNRRQLMTMTANYAMSAAEDAQLTAWMHENLVVRAVASTWTPLAQLERATGAILRPPLDQEAVPFWAPNPWRAAVAAARERKRKEVRRRVGLI